MKIEIKKIKMKAFLSNIIFFISPLSVNWIGRESKKRVYIVKIIKLYAKASTTLSRSVLPFEKTSILIMLAVIKPGNKRTIIWRACIVVGIFYFPTQQCGSGELKSPVVAYARAVQPPRHSS